MKLADDVVPLGWKVESKRKRPIQVRGQRNHFVGTSSHPLTGANFLQPGSLQFSGAQIEAHLPP
ncbi:hypothetical protein [Ktedonobacter racemifer]|uniref:Uncharacterized protein n=1 Tax=Ktedonobacter racemifer DSM 44963 TaxID=485913 RepID=D6U127_KTERA|nr:hypothetical protein [Ktedonobacter racemifer]EFH82517.1 hypothetical protein Krac_3331 [Ktedonobacter racemifer DSM 44963]